MTKRQKLKVALTGLACVAGAGMLSAQIEYNAKEFFAQPHIKGAWLGSYELNTALVPKPNEEEAVAIKAMMELINTDQKPAAFNSLKLAVKPESGAAMQFLLGNFYAEEGDVKNARVYFARAVDKFPNFLKAIKNLGVMDVQEGNFESAIKYLRKAINLGERDHVTFGLLGLCYVNSQQPVSAETAYREAIMLDPSVKDWQLGLAKALLNQDKYRESISILEEILLREPENEILWISQANAYLGIDDPITAVAIQEIVDRLGKSTADSLEFMGNIYMSRNLNDLALTYFKKAIAKDSKRPIKTHINTAEIMAGRGAFTEASALTAEIRKNYKTNIDRENETKLLRLETQIAMGTGQPAENYVPILEKLVETDPLDGNALLMLAEHYTSLDINEAYARADLYFERVVKIGDFQVRGLISWARSYVARERYGRAIPLLERAATLDPQPFIQRYLEQVRQVNLANLGL